jgi:pectate lyase-like protein
MPALIRELAVSGSRKSDGTANASGKVYLYSPGTTTIVSGYTSDDLTEAWVTSGGAIPLDAGGRVSIWVNDPVDVVIADASGTTVNTLLGFNKTRAEQVEVEHPSFTGALTDAATGAVSQGLGGKTSLYDVLTEASDSLGPDLNFLESSGATSRPYIEVIRDFGLSVKNYGAVGSGVVDETAAFQLAFNRAKALDGAEVWIPPGVYLLSSAVSLSSAQGVKVRGAGGAATSIVSTSTSANTFVFTSCTGCGISDLAIVPQSTSTGACIAASSVTTFVLENVSASNGGFGLDVTGSYVYLSNCLLSAAGAAGRALRSAATNLTVIGGEAIAGSGAAIEFTGAAARTSLLGVSFGAVGGSSPTGVLFNASCSGTRFAIADCPTLGLAATTPIDITSITIDPIMSQRGNNADLSITSSAVGATQTPRFIGHNQIALVAASGGAGTVTVAAPAVLPSASVSGRYWDMIFSNSSGGAVTWDVTTAAVYKFATAVPTTPAHTISVRVYWTGSAFREASRADTVT